MPRRKSFENIFDGKVCELQKTISTLEWDIPRITNNELKAHKERKLNELKAELDRLAKEKSVKVTLGGEPHAKEEQEERSSTANDTISIKKIIKEGLE